MTGLRLNRISSLFLILFSAVVLPVFSQEGSDLSLDTGLLLREALLVSVDMSVSTGDTELWSRRVNKITVPGRAVNVGIEGEGSRLNVGLTPYPTDGDTLLLVARNETWFGEEYFNGLTTIPVAYRDEVYYYPLGRADDSADENTLEVRMVINIVPYLDTLDESSREELESVFDSTTRFDLSGEGD